MASQLERDPDETGLLRRVELTLRAEESFPVPVSDGYSVYSALLSVIEDVNPDVSARIHDSFLGGLHSSGLLGRFRDSDRLHHKTVRSNVTYGLSLGVVDPEDEAIFQALLSGLVLEGDLLELSHGSLRIESFESENSSHEGVIAKTGEFDDPTVRIRFQTPTCIEEEGEVTTMFPHRWTVFNSLLGKWNRSCPEELALNIDRETILEGVIEKPKAQTYDTHSSLVNRVENDDGETHNLFRQGFTGECSYAFKQASESVQNAVIALALFGEYSGVGSAVSRGCGNVEVEVENL